MESYYAHPRTELLPFIPAQAMTILDVGCGDGSFGHLLQRRRPGCRVIGVEPAQVTFLTARSRLWRTYKTTAEAFLSTYNGNFDLICFNDVLEHLVEPWNQIRACHRLLLPGRGLVVASVANIRCYPAIKEILLHGDFPCQDSGIFDRRHVRFFTRKSVTRVFVECGFTVDKLQGINPISSRLVAGLSRLSPGRFQDLLFPQFALLARGVAQASSPSSSSGVPPRLCDNK